MADLFRAFRCPECTSDHMVWGGVENADQQLMADDSETNAGAVIHYWECTRCGQSFKQRSSVRLRVCPEEPLNLLVDKYGWAAVLKALEQLARADGFQQLSAAIQPVYDLIGDDQSHRSASDEN